MIGRMLTRPAAPLLRRSYATAKVKLFIKKVGDENSKESQKTIKVVRMIGAGSVITVLCTLFWASAMSGPTNVRETYVDIPDLSKDIRSKR